MIYQVIKEPRFKFIVSISILTVIFLYSIFMGFQYKQLNNIHIKEIETFQRIVGAIVKEYPDLEPIIIHGLLTKGNNSAKEVGEVVLKKYGYDLETDLNNCKGN